MKILARAPALSAVLHHRRYLPVMLLPFSAISCGVPLATISQVLGHRDTEAAKQYISLDSIHLQECALDFSLIGGRRHD